MIETPTALTLRELKESDRVLWDTLLQASSQGCFMQSWLWSEFKELEDYRVFRYGIFANLSGDSRLVGGCIFYFYPRPHGANL
ncbi:MAG TPA: hypothetical protein V6D18_06215, partial [Thermosynechococcaceae cyanobacterium]